MTKRALANWIDGWYEYTTPLPSPELWRRWSGIAILAVAMERRLWIKTGLGILYPNLFTVLVGPPGTGKTLLTSRVNMILKDVSTGGQRELRVAPSSVTGASIIDELDQANTKFLDLKTNTFLEYNALAIISNELGVLLPEYDSVLMNKLTDIYDGFPYGERRRGNNLNIKVERPSFNLLAATTPSYLTSTLPEGAFEQGFMSRTLLCFSGEKLLREVFSTIELHDKLYADLVADLKDIFEDFGSFIFTPEAVTAIETWVKNGSPPVPEHPKLIHYNTRRVAHLLKLCMIASIASGSEHVITQEHYATAIGWLLELEVYLPDIFKSMKAGGDSKAIDECWYYVFVEAAKHGPVHEGRIVAFLLEMVPAHSVPRILDAMERAGILIQEPVAQAGKWYRAKNRKPGT